MKLQFSLATLLVCMTVLAVVVGMANQLPAQTNRAWSAPFPPFRIAGNLILRRQ